MLHAGQFDKLLRRRLRLSPKQVGKMRSGQIHHAGHRIDGKLLTYITFHLTYEEIYPGIQVSLQCSTWRLIDEEPS